MDTVSELLALGNPGAWTVLAPLGLLTLLVIVGTSGGDKALDRDRRRRRTQAAHLLDLDVPAPVGPFERDLFQVLTDHLDTATIRALARAGWTRTDLGAVYTALNDHPQVRGLTGGQRQHAHLTTLASYLAAAAAAAEPWAQLPRQAFLAWVQAAADADHLHDRAGSPGVHYAPKRAARRIPALVHYLGRPADVPEDARDAWARAVGLLIGLNVPDRDIARMHAQAMFAPELVAGTAQRLDMLVALTARGQVRGPRSCPAYMPERRATMVRVAEGIPGGWC